MANVPFQYNEHVYWHRQGYRGRYRCRFLGSARPTDAMVIYTVLVLAHEWNPATPLKGTTQHVALTQLSRLDS